MLGSSEDWLIPNSWIDSLVMFIVVVPTVSSVMSTPSTWIRVTRPLRPPIETPVMPFFVGSKLPPLTT